MNENQVTIKRVDKRSELCSVFRTFITGIKRIRYFVNTKPTHCFFTIKAFINTFITYIFLTYLTNKTFRHLLTNIA